MSCLFCGSDLMGEILDVITQSPVDVCGGCEPMYAVLRDYELLYIKPWWELEDTEYAHREMLARTFKNVIIDDDWEIFATYGVLSNNSPIFKIELSNVTFFINGMKLVGTVPLGMRDRYRPNLIASSMFKEGCMYRCYMCNNKIDFRSVVSQNPWVCHKNLCPECCERLDERDDMRLFDAMENFLSEGERDRKKFLRNRYVGVVLGEDGRCRYIAPNPRDKTPMTDHRMMD